MPIPNNRVFLSSALAAGGTVKFLPDTFGDFAPLSTTSPSASWLGSATDMDGDGKSDLLFGAAASDAAGLDAGRVYVALSSLAGAGATLGLGATTGLVIDGASAGDHAGGSVAGLHDLNGDGRGDILIGAAGSDSSGLDAGEAYVVFGQGPGMVSLNDVKAGIGGYAIRGEAAGDAAGSVVLSLGDMNGDGKDDFLIGAPGNDAGGALDAGAAYVVWGKSNNSAVNLADVAVGIGGFRITDAKKGDAIGAALGTVGDMNGDGIAEILIGSPNTGSGKIKGGATYVVFGKANGTAVDLNTIGAGKGGGFVINGIPGDSVGNSVNGIGDVNGDGLADLLVGAPKADHAYVVFGKAGATAVDLNNVRGGVGGFEIVPEALKDLDLMSIAGGKDLNGDGVADFVIGAPKAGTNGTTTGAVYVVWGGGSGKVDLSLIAQSIGGAKISGTVDSLAGSSVTIVDDQNGDGRADLLIGAPGTGEGSYLLYSPATWQPDATVYGTNGADVIGAGFGSGLHKVGDGADNIMALAGDDAISTGAGDDTLDGGLGADTMTGGTGNDAYWVDNALDVVVENAGEGSDTVNTTVSLTLAANVENLVLQAAGLTGTGNALDNTITGSAGNDLIDGAAGADTMAGGTGNDTYIVDSASDVVVESSGGGTDTVRTTVSLTLGANVENLDLQAAGLTGTGNALDNRITGTAGSDTIDGGAGADTMIGGAGDDTYKVDNTGDVILENAGGGTDTVIASVDTRLSAEVENLVLTGSAHAGTGNALANTITGTSGADALDGGAGADTLIGGAGDDTYTVDNAADVIVEKAGEGTDTVIASADYVLTEGANVENLTLAGAAHHATGNSGDNVLTGGAGADVLDGAGGIDTLIGGDGNDTYVVDGHTDTIIETATGGIDTIVSSVDFALSEGAGIENLTLTGNAHHATGSDGDNVLTGAAGADLLEGGLGNDTLDGGAGADTLVGGAGNDTYVIDNPGDVVVETADGGIDTVVVSTDWTLADNIENVKLAGSGHTLTGNAADNTLTGDTGNDTLDGGGGNDTELGGDGNDTLVSTSGTDVLAGGSGDDVYKIHGGTAQIEDFQGHDTIDASDALGDSLIDLSGATQTRIDGHDVTYGTGGTVTGALNVQFLQDLTGSFADDIANVRTLVPEIVTALDTISGGAAFGVSSFRDKAYGSFGGPGDTVYQTDLSIGATAQTLTQTYTGFIASGGADLPEAQLEALLQTAVRAGTEVGYQSNSARFVVLFTDAPFHTAADGTAAGITTANNGDAIINNGGILENYPELAMLAQALADANITPVFAVTPGLEASYQALADALGRGTVVTLSADSANIVSAITTGLTTATTTHIADAIGGAGNDTLIGNYGANALTGNAGDDTLTGAGGDDRLHGGEGSDTATYTGPITGYTITHNADGTVTISGSEGTDTLDGIEFLKFGADLYTIAGTPVSGVNSAPVITSDGGADTAALSIPENTSAVTTVTATDPDHGTVLTYAIAGGADADKFVIDAATGQLTFATAPDFEAPTDTGTDNVYDVIVAASDGALSATQAIAVTVTDVADGGVLAQITGVNVGAVSEDGTAITGGTLTVTDPDAGEAGFAPLDPATLVGREGMFTFDTATGNWDYTLDNAAAQALAQGEQVIETLTVTSIDGSASETISVTVTGTNDLATITGDTMADVTEAGGIANSAAGTPGASGTLTVTDADTGEASLATTSVSGTYGTFAFDAATGAWTYALDDSRAATQALAAGETATDSLHVQSADGSATETVTVTVHGTDDIATITGSFVGAVTEDGAGTAAGALAIADPDSSHVFATPATTSGTYGNFAFDATTGGWTYTLDNTRAATQALGAGQVVADTLTVATLNGDAGRTISVSVTGVNDAAVIGGTFSGTVTEAVGTTGTSQVSGTLTISDVDNAAQFAAGTYAGARGALALDAAGGWTYTLNNADAVVNGLAAGQTMADSVTVHAADGTTRAIAITIVGVDDPITGTAGADTLNGTAGADTILGLGGNDRISGGEGNDVIDGGAGDDILDGGAGIDTVSYASATGAITLNLAQAGQQSTGGAGKDSLSGFENAIGSNLADSLLGSAGANAIDGGGGADRITGAAGADSLTGGAGGDSFAYLATSESSLSGGWDTIRDFTHLTDRIDLSAIDALPGKGDNTFFWGGTLATANGVWFTLDTAANVTHIFADTDGNTATAEMRIDVSGLVGLTTGDFVL